MLTDENRRNLALAEKMLCPWKIKATTELLRISSYCKSQLREVFN